MQHRDGVIKVNYIFKENIKSTKDEEYNIIFLPILGAWAKDRDAKANAASSGRKHQEAPRNAAKQGNG